MNELRTDLLNESWHNEYQRLRNDMELFRINFILTKKCRCRKNKCIHFKSEEAELFNDRLDKIILSKVFLNSVIYEQLCLEK